MLFFLRDFTCICNLGLLSLCGQTTWTNVYRCDQRKHLFVLKMGVISRCFEIEFLV